MPPRETPERLIKRVASRVSELRRAGGLTQEKLAERLDTTVQYVSKVEVGENLTLSSLAHTANALGVRAADLLDAPALAERTAKRGRGRPRKTSSKI